MDQNKLHLYAHAKLLISGEYLILRGATGLAIPLRYGQSLTIETIDSPPGLHWSAFSNGRLWMWVQFGAANLEIMDTDRPDLARTLQDILRHARKLQPKFLSAPSGLSAKAELNFPPEWGIGSGSSLIANIARWADVDPYLLNSGSFGSSGYDIAAALSDTPILYRNDHGSPLSQPVAFHPPFLDNLWFVYLNRKQNSLQAVRDFAQKEVSPELINTISDLSVQMAQSVELSHFCRLLDEHESLVGTLLNIQPVKEREFSNFEGSIKSLGAWGGDFILAATTHGREYVTNYFENLGYTTLFNYREMMRI